MKRIVICFDGTWNKPAAEALTDIDPVETNVRRFYESIKTYSTDGIQQISWYDQGVGTIWYDHMAGGIFGAGLERNIRQGYEFLANNYQDSDEVYILGFSRGAYSARSLVGMISKCGLIHINSTNELIKEAFSIYRSRGENEETNFSRTQEFRMRNSREIPKSF